MAFEIEISTDSQRNNIQNGVQYVKHSLHPVIPSFTCCFYTVRLSVSDFGVDFSEIRPKKMEENCSKVNLLHTGYDSFKIHVLFMNFSVKIKLLNKIAISR